MSVYQLSNFGITKTKLQTTNHRYIDDQNDIYPPPIMTSSPSSQVYGFDKLRYAMMYLRKDRVIQLMMNYYDEINIFGTDYYKQNIIGSVRLAS